MEVELDGWIAQLMERGERIGSEREVSRLCAYVRGLLLEESNAVRVASPVTVCGDIHGQFDDLLELFRIGGRCPSTSYLFLGDYVDRGRDSVEVFELLMCLKARYPDRMTLLRGNHESRQITQVYGFYDECLFKYGSSAVWRECCDVFDCLNVAALIDDSTLCVHGGLSPSIATVDDIQTLERLGELPTDGPLSDLLWSDPAEDDRSESLVGFQASNRGSGYIFGKQAVDDFHFRNDLALLCRAHQLVMDGFKYHFEDTNCLTMWSAPNYCGRCGNVGALLEINGPDRRFVTFDSPKQQQHNLVAGGGGAAGDDDDDDRAGPYDDRQLGFSIDDDPDVVHLDSSDHPTSSDDGRKLNFFDNFLDDVHDRSNGDDIDDLPAAGGANKNFLGGDIR